MLTEILWGTKNALVGLLLLQAARGKFFSKYLVFYLYLSQVLLLSLIRWYIYEIEPSAYQVFYWYTQFLSVAVGYCVIWEICRQALADYVGAARMAHRVLSVLFVVVVAKVLSSALSGTVWSLAQTTAELERNLRFVQTTLLMAILSLLLYYSVPIGRNLKGIILGYGFFLGTSVISLTLRSHLGDGFQLWWQYLQQMAYLVTLLIWSGTLWSYQPNPKPEKEIALEHDYEVLAAQTANTLARARSYILRTVRP
jgi:hypothetical protein